MKRATLCLTALLGFFAGSLSGGCAFVDQRLELGYSAPSEQIDPGKPLVRVVVPKEIEGAEYGKKGEPIIAHVKNGYGMTTAKVYPKNSVPEWVAGALAAELRARGYPCEIVAESLGEDPEIRTRITHLWVETDVDFWSIAALAELDLAFEVREGGSVVDSFEIQGRSEERSIIGDDQLREESIQQGLEYAMRDAVPRLIAAIEGESETGGEAEAAQAPAGESSEP